MSRPVCQILCCWYSLGFIGIPQDDSNVYPQHRALKRTSMFSMPPLPHIWSSGSSIQSGLIQNFDADKEFNPLPDIPIPGSSNSAVKKDMM